jgi:hypothetical protein
MYHLPITQKQLDKHNLLNKRNEVPITFFDPIRIVEETDSDAAMITGKYGTLTIGILPDGSSHS